MRWVRGGGGRENRRAVSAGKICYRRGNAMWQLSMATAGGSGLKFAFLAVALPVCVSVCVCVNVALYLIYCKDHLSNKYDVAGTDCPLWVPNTRPHKKYCIYR